MMIWSSLLVVKRTVVVDVEASYDRNLTYPEIREECPVILHICREARQLALSKYGTIPPAMEMKGWGFIRHTKFAELRTISTTLGLKPLTRVHSMYSAIGVYE